MRLITLFTISLTLLIGAVEGKSLDLFAPLKLLEVEYKVEKSPNVEGIGATRAVYHPKHDHIIVSPQGLFESDREYFHTILHELVHWTGSRYDRAWRLPHVDVFQEEIIAEITAQLISKHIYKGKLEYDPDNVDAYLNRHPKARKLTDHEMEEVRYCIAVAYDYLLIVLKEVDTENVLQLQ